MALATAPATCHRCKGPIGPGDDIRRYNRPAVGTLYHAVCPTLAPKPTPVEHAGPLTGDIVDAIVARVAAAVSKASAHASPPPPADASSPSAASEPSECTYSQALVEDGYEPMGFDCAGHDWLPLADATRTIEDAVTEYTAAIRSLATTACGTRDRYGVPMPQDSDTTDALARCMHGLAPTDAKALVRYASGVNAGMILAAEAMRADDGKRDTVRAVSRDEWRAQHDTLSLAVLVDDDAADALMANEQTVANYAGQTCQCGIGYVDDAGVERNLADCATHGIVKDTPLDAAKLAALLMGEITP